MYNVIVLVHGNMHPHVGRFHSYDIAMRYAMEEGWVVEADNSTLRGLGLMSSSSRNCSW